MGISNSSGRLQLQKIFAKLPPSTPANECYVVSPCLFILKNTLRAPSVARTYALAIPSCVRPPRSRNLVHKIVIAVTKANGLYVFTPTNNNPIRAWTADTSTRSSAVLQRTTLPSAPVATAEPL